MADLVNKDNRQTTNEASFSRKRKTMMREQNFVVCDTIRALALCHNVTPTFSEHDRSEVEYQASSPDEIALVKFAATMGMNLNERD
jgi:phospholipid-translocating ATPase